MRFHEVYPCPKDAPPKKSQSWVGVQCTSPQQGVKEWTFCSGTDLDYLLRGKLKTHLAYLHPRQVALNRRMGHGDADWICASTSRSSPRLDLCLQSPAALRLMLAVLPDTPGDTGLPRTVSGTYMWRENVLPHTLVYLPRVGATPSHPKQLSKLTDVR